MPSDTRSRLLAENAALRARLVELEGLLSKRSSDRGAKPRKSDEPRRRRAEDKLFLDSRRLEGIMKALPVGVCFSDDTSCQRITGNPAFYAQFEANFEDNLSASASERSVLGRKVRHFKDGKEVRRRRASDAKVHG